MNKYLQGQCIWLIIILLIGMATGYIETQQNMISFSIGFIGMSIILYPFLRVKPNTES